MKKTFLFAVVSAFLLFSCSTAPNGPLSFDGCQINPQVYGVYGVYGDNVAEIADAPEGYDPVYISHYGRHGSRYILANRQYTFVKSVLDSVKNEGLLTECGQELYNRFAEIYPQIEGKAGLLTPLGEEQHRQIASRMYSRFSNVFDGHKVVALSTNLQRTEKSMKAFEGELLKHNPSLEISSRVAIEDMYYLNPLSQSNHLCTPADIFWKGEDAPWRAEYHEIMKDNVDWENFGSRIFTDLGRVGKICRIEDFEMELFAVCIHMQGLPVESQGFFDFFTEKELEKLAEYGDNYTFYMKTGRSPKSIGRGWALSESLLEDFINKAECDIMEGEPAVRLRFGHDGCITSLFALMELEGWNKSESVPENIKNVWDVSKVKMASNIQMIFYRGRENGDIILRVLYNEADMALPFQPVPGSEYFYRWEDFKSFYLPRVRAAEKLLKDTENWDANEFWSSLS